MSEKHITVEILSPEKTVFKGDAKAVFLPSVLGNFEVLPGHAAVVAALEKGSVIVRADVEKKFEIKSGIARVKNNVVTVCVEL